MIDVSVIVPIYNVKKYIKKCLDSLVIQNFSNMEIILVNDGSTDNSLEIISEYKEKYPDLIKIYNKDNGGAASARNFGIKKALGNYIIFVDSDDWVSSNLVSKLYNKAKNTSSDIVVCGAYSVTDNIENEIDTFHNYSNNMSKNYMLNCSGPCWQIIKKNLIVDNNLYFLEHHFYEDIAIIPSLCLFAKKIEYLPMNLYYYLIRSGSTMNQQKYSKSLEDIFDSMENLSNIFVSKNCYQEYYNEIEYLYIEHLLHAASLRFFKFKEYGQLEKIVNIMNEKFSNWNKNIYYKKKSFKYKVVCKLFYLKKYKILEFILKG